MTITLNKSRIASSVIAAVYIAVGFAAEGGEGGLKVLAMVILPLACIWFGDAMGGYIGQAGSIGITAPSPGVIVSILGWLLLLLPKKGSVLTFIWKSHFHFLCLATTFYPFPINRQKISRFAQR